MKKLLSLFFALSTLLSCVDVAHAQEAQQVVTLSPFTQIEHVNGEWTATLPITLNYALVKTINASSFFYGAGIGAGINLSDHAEKIITFPVLGFIGYQFGGDFPAIALGGGLDANTAAPMLAINLNFYIFKPGDSGSNQRKAAPVELKSIVGNDDYKRSNIGFQKDN